MQQKIESITDPVSLLKLALASRNDRARAVKAFQNYMFDASARPSGANAEHWDTLSDLAFDLDYYESDPIVRREDPSHYGDQRLEAEITEVLEKPGDVASAGDTGHQSS